MSESENSIAATRPTPTWIGVVVRWLADVSLALHFVAAAGWWWLSPKGFPFATSPYWTNSVLPLAAMGLALAGIVAVHFRRTLLAAAVVLCFSAAWISAALAGRIEFPISLAGVWLLPVMVGCVGGGLFLLLARGERMPRVLWALSFAAGVAVGVLVVRWQVPEPPSTLPWMSDHASASASDGPSETPRSVRAGGGAEFYPGAEILEVRLGDVQLNCSPLLQFDRVSPDRFWSLLARRRYTQTRHFLRVETDGEFHTVCYDDGSLVRVPIDSTDEEINLEAITPLDRPTYSHLNTFCELSIAGHRSLSLAFSPCPDAIVEVLPADYPVGRPARFAYVDAAGSFFVCEATSGEKGPFRVLATGALKRGEPLAIDLFDAGTKIGAITLEDWSGQLSTALSPSAGWGVPVNAIEFQRMGDSPEAECDVWITLAATSVGRGFETVGHAAGTYRNRIKIRAQQNAR